MTWRQKEARHQQPWLTLCKRRFKIFRSLQLHVHEYFGLLFLTAVNIKEYQGWPCWPSCLEKIFKFIIRPFIENFCHYIELFFICKFHLPFDVQTILHDGQESAIHLHWASRNMPDNIAILGKHHHSFLVKLVCRLMYTNTLIIMSHLPAVCMVPFHNCMDVKRHSSVWHLGLNRKELENACLPGGCLIQTQLTKLPGCRDLQRYNHRDIYRYSPIIAHVDVHHWKTSSQSTVHTVWQCSCRTLHIEHTRHSNLCQSMILWLLK